MESKWHILWRDWGVHLSRKFQDIIFLEILSLIDSAPTNGHIPWDSLGSS